MSLIFSFSLSVGQSFVSRFLLVNARTFLHKSYCRFGVPINLIVGSGWREFVRDSVIFSGEIF